MTLIFDTSVLSCFARACRLPLLEQLTSDTARRVTTRAVLAEVEEGRKLYKELGAIIEQDWLKSVAVDGQALIHFAEYSKRLVDRRERNRGEASVLAWAKAHAAVVFSDDLTAIVLAREQGIRTLRTLVLVADGVRRGLLSQDQAGLPSWWMSRSVVGLDSRAGAGPSFCSGPTAKAFSTSDSNVSPLALLTRASPLASRPWGRRAEPAAGQDQGLQPSLGACRPDPGHGSWLTFTWTVCYLGVV